MADPMAVATGDGKEGGGGGDGRWQQRKMKQKRRHRRQAVPVEEKEVVVMGRWLGWGCRASPVPGAAGGGVRRGWGRGRLVVGMGMSLG